MKEPAKGLRLGSLALMSDAEEGTINNKWSTDALVEEQFRKLGFSLRPKPEFEVAPLTAHDVCNLTPQEHAEMYTRHMAWRGYALQYTAKIKSVLLEISNEKTDISARMRQDLKKMKNAAGEKITEADIKDRIWLSPRHQELTREEQIQTQLQSRLETQVRIMEENLKVISREIEVLKLDYQNENVNGNIPKRFSGMTRF